MGADGEEQGRLFGKGDAIAEGDYAVDVRAPGPAKYSSFEPPAAWAREILEGRGTKVEEGEVFGADIIRVPRTRFPICPWWALAPSWSVGITTGGFSSVGPGATDALSFSLVADADGVIPKS